MRTKAEIGNSEWFGGLPKGWNMVPLSALFRFSKGLSITKADLIKTGKPVISYGQIHSKQNIGVEVRESLLRRVPNDLAGETSPSRVLSNGFVFADTSEDLEGCGNNVRNDSSHALYGGYHTVVLNPRGDFNSKFLAYLFTTDAWRLQIRRDLVDVKLFSVNQTSLNETYVVIPPTDVQKTIVSYLDERCAAIDEDVAKRREVIEKLKEYKKSLIARVVTKGLDPTAEMKDSSVEWIDEVPTDWNLSPLKSLYRLSKGLSITKADLAETGEPVISYGQIHAKWNPGTSIRSNLIRYVPNKIAASHPASRATAGSFIFADTSEDVEGCGNAAYVDEDRPVYGGYHTIIATPITNVCGKYFAYQFLTKAWRSQLIRQFVDVKLFSITQRALQQTSLIVPSYLEQEKIAAYLDERCADIDEAISRQEQLIEKLGEYRRSIIHHAVTGKIDCSEA